MHEATFVDLPVVLSDQIGPTDVARPGVNAKVHSCGDTAALAESLRELLDDPAERARLEATVAGFLRAIHAVCSTPA